MRLLRRLLWTASSLLMLLGAPAASLAEVQVTATSPHAAGGTDASQILVTVTDEFGNPVADGDVLLDISPPYFTSQIMQPVYHLRATNRGNGQYTASFTSAIAGPYAVLATEQNSLETGIATVEFISPYAPGSPGPRAKRRRPIRADAVDAVTNCKNFFDKLDEEFYPPILAEKIKNETDATRKAELEQRKQDTLDVVNKVVKLDIDIETKLAKGEVPTREEKDALDKAIRDNKEALKRVSEAQKKLFEEFFGKPVDPDKFQACTELFNNFKLVDDFDKAIEKIREQRAGGPKKKVVERGPDASIAHIRWAKFAKIAIQSGIDADLWRTLLPTLAKGSAITADVLMDNDPGKPGIQPAMQKEDSIKKRREEYDPLRPKTEDGDAERKKKLEELEKKLVALIKKIRVDKMVIAMVPGTGGNYQVVAKTAAPLCTGGVRTAVAPQVNGLLALERVGDDLFGLGVDASGRTYLTMGKVTGSEARFTITGYGLSPTSDLAVTAFTGFLQGDSISGQLEGLAQVRINGREEQCTWLGSFDAHLTSTVPVPTATDDRNKEPRN